MVKKKRNHIPKQGACLFCNSDEDNELKFGKLIFHEKSKVRVHHYCLLFASGLCQSGQGDQGIEGFLVPDIKAEYKRATNLRCRHCSTKTATIGCVIKACKSSYHFGCGVDNKAMFLFYDNFISYCHKHRPQQDDPEIPPDNPTSTCPICLESVEAKVSEDTLRTPCCTNTWFHRDCLQRQALSAGYFFRCGICNNKEDFQNEMKQFGIYIPEQDAAWELEDNAYQELYQRHNQCDITPCICPKGRKYHPSRGKWEIVLCDTCGSRGCHLTCGELTNQWDDWVCDQCTVLVEGLDSSKWHSGTKSKKTSSTKKSSTKKTTPKSTRKEKLPGKTPRKPLPSHKPIKTSGGKARLSMSPSFSPPSANCSQLSIHMPSVSSSPNAYHCSMSSCKNSSCKKTCKDGSPCKGNMAASKHMSPSPPHFCCTSQDRFAHSHNSIPPHLSVEGLNTGKTHGQICQPKRVTVKTTTRMSMRGPARYANTFKAATVSKASDTLNSVAKSQVNHVTPHHSSLSGVHLCARHRNQIENHHSASSPHMATWNRNDSTGSTSSHNSSTSSHNSSTSSSHNSSNSSDDYEMPKISPNLPSNAIRNIDMNNSGKEVVVQLKQLPQLILATALSGDKSNVGVNAKSVIPHTCGKRKLEEVSFPRKKLKIAKSPPQKKFENKSPLPRKTSTPPTSAQKKKPSSAKKVDLSTPSKKAKISCRSPAKVPSSKTMSQIVSSPNKSKVRSPAKSNIKVLSPRKTSPKKRHPIVVSPKKGNMTVMTPRNATMKTLFPEKMLATSEKTIKSPKKTMPKVPSTHKTSPVRALKHTCKSMSNTKQSTLEMFLQPNRKHSAPQSSRDSTPVLRKKIKVTDTHPKQPGRSLLSIKSLCRNSKGKTKKSPEIVNLVTPPPPPSKYQGIKQGGKVVFKMCKETEQIILLDKKPQSPTKKKTTPCTQSSPDEESGIKKLLQRNNDIDSDISSDTIVNRGKSWNAYMNRGKLVFSKSPPPVKSPETITQLACKSDVSKEENSFRFSDDALESLHTSEEHQSDKAQQTSEEHQSDKAQQKSEEDQSEKVQHSSVDSTNPSTTNPTTSTPVKLFIRQPECRFPTRCSPRLIKEREEKLIAAKSSASKLPVPPVPIVHKDRPKIWVPSSLKGNTINTSPVTGQSTQPSEKSGSSKKRRCETIMYPNRTTLNQPKEPKFVRRLIPSVPKTTAMSQEDCFFEVLEFNKTMLATTAMSQEDHFIEVLEFNKTMLATSPTCDVKALEKSSVSIEGPQETDDDDDDFDEDGDNLDNRLVRRSSRFDTGTPVKGGIFVRRSSRDKANKSELIKASPLRRARASPLRRAKACDTCRVRKKACYCAHKSPVTKEMSSHHKSPVHNHICPVSTRVEPLSRDVQNGQFLPQSNKPNTEVCTTDGLPADVTAVCETKDTECMEKTRLENEHGHSDDSITKGMREGEGIEINACESMEDDKEDIVILTGDIEDDVQQQTNAVNSSILNEGTDTNQKEGPYLVKIKDDEVLVVAEKRSTSTMEEKHCSISGISGKSYDGDNASNAECSEDINVLSQQIHRSNQILIQPKQSNDLLPTSNLTTQQLQRQDDLISHQMPVNENSYDELSMQSNQVGVQQEKTSDSPQTAKRKFISKWVCKRHHKHKHTCQKKHGHYPVLNKPYLHGPHAKRCENDNAISKPCESATTQKGQIKDLQPMSDLTTQQSHNQDDWISHQTHVSQNHDLSTQSNEVGEQTHVSDPEEKTQDSQHTEKKKPLSKWTCQRRHKHQLSCLRKHVHYPVCNKPHLHGPHAKNKRSRVQKSKPIPVHVHKPRCLAPHLHGPQTPRNHSVDCMGVCCKSNTETNIETNQLVETHLE